MSKILSREDVIKVARLAKIKLTEEEIDKFVIELNSILDYVKQLQNTYVEGLKPTEQVTGLKNVWRDDVVVDYCYKPSELLKNVARTEDGYIKVNRMI